MIQAHIAYSMMSDKIEIFIADKNNLGRVPFKITLEKLPLLSSGHIMEPSITLEKEEFTEIANSIGEALVESGLYKKPENANDTELRATIVTGKQIGRAHV